MPKFADDVQAMKDALRPIIQQHLLKLYNDHGVLPPKRVTWNNIDTSTHSERSWVLGEMTIEWDM